METNTDTDPLPAVSGLEFLGFPPEAIMYCGLMLILIILSAIMSASEVAFFSISKQERANLESDKHSGSSKQVLRLLESPQNLLATILIGNNVVNLALVLISTLLINATLRFGGNEVVEFVVNVISVTLFIVLFGEVIPKIYSNTRNVRFAKQIAPFIAIIQPILKPLAFILVSSTNALERRLAKLQNNQNFTFEEIDKAIDIATHKTVSTEEKKLLKGIVKFGGISVKQIMRNRMDIVALNSDESFSEIRAQIVESGYSRFPVYTESLDTVVGIFLSKELLKHTDIHEKFDWISACKPAIFVSENTKIDDVLTHFQEKRSHMAIVVDEFGGTSGLVTLEDILEEIFGEINDEFDELNEQQLIKPLSETEFQFEGKTAIHDFCRYFDISTEVFEPYKGESDTMAGLLLEVNGQFPAEGEKFQIEQFEFIVLEATPTRILTIQCKKDA